MEAFLLVIFISDPPTPIAQKPPLGIFLLECPLLSLFPDYYGVLCRSQAPSNGQLPEITPPLLYMSACLRVCVKMKALHTYSALTYIYTHIYTFLDVQYVKTCICLSVCMYLVQSRCLVGIILYCICTCHAHIDVHIYCRYVCLYRSRKLYAQKCICMYMLHLYVHV